MPLPAEGGRVAPEKKGVGMSRLTQQVKEGAGHALASVSNGWRELKERASGALTHFRFKDEKSTDELEGALPALGNWGFMTADVAETRDRVVVRLEAPGMSRDDFNIELRGDTLSIQGEKRMEREFRGDGHRTIESAYGSFRRHVALPATVDSDKAKATYRDGVLRVVLPKAEGAAPRRFSIRIN
jgi:HSP20 family protein